LGRNGKNLIMFILLYGPDTYRSQQQLKKSIEDFKLQRDPSGINSVIFEGEKIEGSQVLEAMVASPFLGEKRLIVIKNLSQKNDKEFFKKFLELAEANKIPSTSVVIFWEADLGEKKLPEFFEFLKKQQYSKYFDNLTGAQLENWIKKQIETSGVSIEKFALAAIVNHPLSSDIQSLSNELDKMVAYTSSLDDKSITLKIVNIFLPNVVDSNSFHFLDSLLARNTKDAIKLLHDQWIDNNAEAALFGTLIWQFKILLVIKDYTQLHPGVTTDVVAKNLKLSPFVVKKAVAVLRSFDFEKLKSIYHNLLEIDIKVKTGEGNYKMLLDLLVAKVCR